MYIIGISGQTGAGKSTAANILSQLGYGENLEVDSIGHILLKNEETKKELRAAFGNDIFDEYGEIIRKELGAKAFTSKENTEKLNSIMHPAMVKMVREYIKQKEKEGKQYIIINAALLFKMKLDCLCDIILYINSNQEIRLKRLIENRGMSKEAAQARLCSQDPMPENDNRIRIITNDTNKDDLYNKLKSIKFTK